MNVVALDIHIFVENISNHNNTQIERREKYIKDRTETDRKAGE